MATERYLLQPAPGGLAFVQDLLNTRVAGGHGTDLLATLDQARAWLSDALADFPADDGVLDGLPSLSERDLHKLRALRSGVDSVVSGGNVLAHSDSRVPARLSITGTGEVTLRPSGRGWRWLESAIWREIFLAQRAGTWKRLKLCANPPCNSAFYDRSKNNSGVWHDVRTCGNAVNLRASRARRRNPTR